MLLSIIIVNWNTCDLLADCLASVTAAAPPVNGVVEILVVDNNSGDGSAAMIREQFPHVHLIANQENVGFARANNQAIRAGQGEYLLLLNSDTLVRPDTLRHLLEFMAAHPQAGAAGPRLLNGDDSLQHGCHPMLTPEREFWRLLFLEKLWPRATYPLEQWDNQMPRRVEAIKGASLLLRRAALDQVGLLDESYFMYTEEVDLCYRLSQAGWELWYVPQAVVVHFGGASSRQAHTTMYVTLYRSKAQFYRKFGGDWRARRFKLWLTLAYLPRAVATTLAGLVLPNVRDSARLYRHFMTELPRF